MSPKPATWNREDRDLLIELRTQMSGMREEIAAARVEIKDINTGIGARLLNLESNAVTKIVHDALAIRVDGLEDSRIEYRTQLKTWGIVWGVVTFVAPMLFALYLNAR